MSSNQIETIHNIIANYQSVNYQKINVYGIVTYIGSKSTRCTNLTLVDDTCTETEKLKSLIFDQNPPPQTICEPGDIVRLNRIKIQTFNGQPQGICNQTVSSWIRFKRNDPHSHMGQSTNVNDDDINRVKHLLNWLNTNPKNQALFEANLSVPKELSFVSDNELEMAASVMNMQNLNTNNQDLNKINLKNFSSLQKDSYVDIVCQICALCDNKGVRFALVWDGFRSDFSIHQEQEFIILPTKNRILFSKNITGLIYPIYIFDEFIQQLETLEAGDFVLFKNARVCPAPNNSDADLLIKMPGIQNSNQSRYGRSILKLGSYETNSYKKSHDLNMCQVIENISKKSKEYDLKFVSEEQFRSELRSEMFDDTFGDLLEKNSGPIEVKKKTILSQVNELMNEDTQMYYSEEEEEQINEEAMIENQNLLNQQTMAQDQVHENKKIDPLAISQDIFILKKLVNLTQICPYLSPSVIGISTQTYEKQYPFYTNIKNFLEDSASKLYIKCKLVAKLFNFSAISSPHISMVFVKCKKCHYLNFTPIHLAGAYQQAHLNNLLNIADIKCSSQIPGTAHQDPPFMPFHSEENCDPNIQKCINFSLDWLETATPSNFGVIKNTQGQSDDCMVDYGYSCPRCTHDQEDSQDHQVLEYVYRLWFILRDADAQLNPCLIEEDLAIQFLDGIEPIKFYTNQNKGYQVYQTIRKKLDKKYLITLEMFNLKLIRNQNEDNYSTELPKRLDYVYKIVKLEQIASN